jgi:hypothetical protein
LFNHEAQLQLELSKLNEQLKTAEENEAKEAQGQEAKDETKEGECKETTTNSEISSASSSHVTNGLLKTLLNGDSTDNEATAVNTPDRSITPKVETETEPQDNSEDVAISAEMLRVRILHLEKLLRFLEAEFAPTRQKLIDLLVNGDIKFGLLWCLFRLGSVISFKDYESGLVMAGEVSHSIF